MDYYYIGFTIILRAQFYYNLQLPLMLTQLLLQITLKASNFQYTEFFK